MRRYLAPFRRHFDTLLTSIFVSTTLDNVNNAKMHVNNNVAVKTVGGISLCHGGKLEESDGYNYFYVVFHV